MRYNSCREEEPETATHALLKISMPESSTWSIQLRAAQEAVLIYVFHVCPYVHILCLYVLGLNSAVRRPLVSNCAV